MNDVDGAPETDAAAGASEGETGAPSLADELLARDQEIADLKDRLLRAVAETENVRRRLERERGDAVQYAMTGFARDILAVADNLERALAAWPADAPNLDQVKTGIEATRRELHTVFQRHGVARVETEGKQLDPHLHQAMLEVDSEHHEPGAIVQELQSGYLIKDRLLRPALVSVARAKAVS
jgi:molecular chaperone GrpE